MGIRLLKKIGRWRVKARVRFNGRILQKQITLEPGRTKENAKELLEQIKKDLRIGITAPNCSLKLSLELFKDILRVYREKSPHAPFSKQQNSAVDKLDNDIGDVPINAFPDRFEAYLLLLSKCASPRGGKRSNASHNRPIEIARASFNVCLALGLVECNPITRARFPELEEIPRDVSITEDEKDSIVRIARENRRTAHIADALNFSLQVPCRKSEIVGMKVRDIDLFSKSVRVRNGTTKNDRGNDKPIPPDMIAFFSKRVKDAKNLDEPVFYRVIKKSQVVPLGDFKNAWNTVRVTAKLPTLRIHDTRHVSATDLVDNGTPEQVVMSIANWKTNMLRTYYNRNPKKALTLVQFKKREHSVNTVEEKRA